MKTILVPTDFSDCAGYASETAMELAKVMGAEVHFYHFTHIPVNWTQLSLQDTVRMYPDVTKKVDEIKSRLKDLANKADQNGVSARWFIGYNETADKIAEYAEQSPAAMIVMGSRGSKGLKEFFLGSNAQKIVRISKVPVFIIKQCLKTVKVSRMLFVSNFEEEMLEAFHQAVSLAQAFGARLDLVYVNTPTAFRETWEIEEKMAPFKVVAEEVMGQAEIVNTQLLEEGIRQYCEKHQEGILTIATHGNRVWSNLVTGSVAELLVNHLHIPIVSIPVK